jgi:alanyl-tRNA synthetase
MEFYRDTNGVSITITMKSVDTGMGFERLCSILQNCVKTNYHNDVFMPIISEIESISKIPL